MQIVNDQLEYLHAQQASAWIGILENAGPQQRAEFVAWLKQSPRNVLEILMMIEIDRALCRIDPERVHDIEALVRKVDRRTVLPTERFVVATALSGRWRAWPWAALAAGILVASVAGWNWLGSGRSAGWQEFQTITTEQRAFALEDGSIIHLNTNSRADVRFTKQSRDVRLLQGEVLFRVHHDPNRPFRVYTSDATIQDLGTEFDVYERSDRTVVAVVEGRVRVSPQQAAGPVSSTAAPLDRAGAKVTSSTQAVSRTLSADQEAEINHAGLITVSSMPEISDAIAWQQRRLVFRQQTLAHIIEEFNRYNQRQIRLEAPAAMNRLYTGVFDADDPDSLVQVLAGDPTLAVERLDDVIVIRAR